MFCIQCGEKQLDDATICSKCAAPIPPRTPKVTDDVPIQQESKKKPAEPKKSPFIIIALGVMLLIFSCSGIFTFLLSTIMFGPQIPSSQSKKTETTPAPVTSRTINMETTKEKTEYGLHQWFSCGDFKYKFFLCRINRPMINHETKYPPEGAELLEVIYIKENISNSTKSESADTFKILDSKGREFAPKFNASGPNEYEMKYDDYWLAIEDLQPGLQRKFALVYELPKDVFNGSVYISIPNGLFADNIKVLLNQPN